MYCISSLDKNIDRLEFFETRELVEKLENFKTPIFIKLIGVDNLIMLISEISSKNFEMHLMN